MSHLRVRPEEEAMKMLLGDDEERRRRSRQLYGIDTIEPGLYDLVIHMGKLSTDADVEIIAKTASMEFFQATEESRKQMELLYQAARAQAALVGEIPPQRWMSSSGQLQEAHRQSRRDLQREGKLQSPCEVDQPIVRGWEDVAECSFYAVC